MRSSPVVLVVTTCAMLAMPRSARAAPCESSATIEAEPDLLGPVAAALHGRGIAVNEAGCAGVRVRVSRDGTHLLVQIDTNLQPVRRSVSDVASVATIIESWVRNDMAAPLLVGTEPELEPAAIATSPPTIEEHVLVLQPRGIHVFSAGETALASDGTVWLGAQLGACVRLGPVCATARARAAQVIAGPHAFDGPVDRHAMELLFGGDIPLSYRGVLFSPGLAVGVGSIHTSFEDQEGMHMGRETGGMRGDAHVTVSIPLHHQLSIDVAAGIDVVQQTEVEHVGAMNMPGDPLGFLQFSAGFRYGGL